MNVAVVVFPGSNCERDVARALRSVGADPELVWHSETDLSGCNGVVLPGGFAHGDYLRPGAIARLSPVMESVTAEAARGTPILGLCNGFQILCEAGLLPGAFVANRDLRFICRLVPVRVVATDSVLTRTAREGQVLRIPLNSYLGNYTPPQNGLEDTVGRAVLRYCGPSGEVGREHNPNGSTGSIAGIANSRGNVAALMPHPERSIDEALGSADGRVLLESFVAALAPSYA